MSHAEGRELPCVVYLPRADVCKALSGQKQCAAPVLSVIILDPEHTCL